MSTRKLPRPIWTNAPAAICDVEHRGCRFRIEVHTNFGGAVWITIKHEHGEDIDVPPGVSHRFWKDTDMWRWKMTQQAGEHGELDLELPHRAVIRMLDAAIAERERKQEARFKLIQEKQKQWAAQHPELAGSGVLQQLRARAAAGSAEKEAKP